MLPTLWLAGFVLGVSLFTPVSSYMLGIDYYAESFPGAQVAVKVTVCYEVAFVALQLLCHLADTRLPLSRAARIEARHMLGVVIMAFVIVWDRVIIGSGQPPAYALSILLAVVTLNGALDGMAVGAVFGEMAILGPSSAHALVAGTAGVMPLLAVLRIIFKAALPATTAGLRLSVVLYFAAAAVVLLAGLAAYCLIVQPAISAARVDGHVDGLGSCVADELGVMPLVPMLTQTNTKQSAGAAGAAAQGNRQLQVSLSLPSSMRGTSLLVRRVHTGLPPSHLRCGSVAGAVHVMEMSGTLRGPSQVGMLTRGGSSRRHELPRTMTPPVRHASDRNVSRQLSRRITGSMEAQQSKLSAAYDSCALPPAATITIVEADEEISSSNSISGDGSTKEQCIGVEGDGKEPAAQQKQPQEQQQTCKDTSSSVDSQQQHHQQQQQLQEQQAGGEQLMSPFLQAAHRRESCDLSWTLPAAVAGAAAHAAGLQQRHTGPINQSITLGQLKSAVASGQVAPLLDNLIQKDLSSKPVTARYFVPGQSVWRSNWLLLKGNVWYVAATVLTYVCNYTVFPAFITYVVPSPALGSWYPLLLVTSYGVGDLAGKLLPLWRPARPEASVMALAVARLLLFLALFSVALLLQAGPYVFFPAVLLMALSGWYEAMIFSLACEGQHPDDAYQVESMLAIQLDFGIAAGSVLSLAWSAGPWAVLRA